MLYNTRGTKIEFERTDYTYVFLQFV